MQSVVGSGVDASAASSPSQQTMWQATVVDSFVREVLRMKGDSVNLVRESIRDVELGGYLIPKGNSAARKLTRCPRVLMRSS